ncbi:uncharacterized protein LOC100191264 [Zea mays]|jgi:hypothetical protein|uniref:Uncharacterized protein n=1 Tax=Zea mays TaxID=4577 RepID=B4F868_MAIZE|nr:uncharacterized protein LOC100191264 [Zea mays]ACF78311.1 unknown [Zea mays]|eukprot:NP_001130170.1 uncharacterized protein LOC100191264 [Zea mays]
MDVIANLISTDRAAVCSYTLLPPPSSSASPSRAFGALRLHFPQIHLPLSLLVYLAATDCRPRGLMGCSQGAVRDLGCVKCYCGYRFVWLTKVVYLCPLLCVYFPSIHGTSPRVCVGKWRDEYK